MTQLQKIAWLNLAFFPLLGVVLILPELGVLSRTAQHILLCLLLAGVLVAAVLMAKMPWDKGKVEDERDRRFRQRSFAAAYLVLMCCLFVGLAASIIAFPRRRLCHKMECSWNNF